MWIYVWLAVTAFALIIEFVTADMVTIWFAGGGLVAMILAACGLEWYVHVPVFIVVSFAAMLVFRKMVIEKLGKGEVKTNAETAVGKDFTLLSPITFGQAGSIKINGVVWNAVGENEDEVIDAGSVVTIKAIKGNKYIVKKKDE